VTVSFITSFPRPKDRVESHAPAGTDGPLSIRSVIGGSQWGQQQLLRSSGRNIPADALTLTGLFIAAHYSVMEFDGHSTINLTAPTDFAGSKRCEMVIRMAYL